MGGLTISQSLHLVKEKCQDRAGPEEWDSRAAGRLQALQ